MPPLVAIAIGVMLRMGTLLMSSSQVAMYYLKPKLEEEKYRRELLQKGGKSSESSEASQGGPVDGKGAEGNR